MLLAIYFYEDLINIEGNAGSFEVDAAIQAMKMRMTASFKAVITGG
jgi:hypothetical protein